MSKVMTGPHAQGALLARTIKGANEAVSKEWSDDTKLTQEMQDVYLQDRCEMHREQNKAFRQSQELREAAIRSGRWGALPRR